MAGSPPPAMTMRVPVKIGAAADVILHRARGLEALQPGQRRAVGAEGASPGGDDDGAGADDVAPVGAQGEGAAMAGQALDPAAEQAGNGEGGDLPIGTSIGIPSIAGWAKMS
jgi:hypothetical protein